MSSSLCSLAETESRLDRSHSNGEDATRELFDGPRLESWAGRSTRTGTSMDDGAAFQKWSLYAGMRIGPLSALRDTWPEPVRYSSPP